MARAQPQRKKLDVLADISARLESIEDVLRLVLSHIVLEEAESVLRCSARREPRKKNKKVRSA